MRSRTDYSKMPSGHLGGRGIAQILVHGPFEIVYIFSRQFVASQYFRKITSCDPVKLIILWLKANYPHSVAVFFSKILGCHELSRKHIHDFKRPMNQNLDFPLPPKCPLGIIEKSVRERIDNVVVKTNYPTTSC